MTWMSQNAGDAPEAAEAWWWRPFTHRSLLGAVIGGLLLDNLSISATFIGSLVLAVIGIAFIGDGRRLLKLEGNCY